MTVGPVAALLERGPGVAEDDVTLGELSRNITAMRGDFDRRFMEVNARLDNLQFVSRDVYTAQMAAVNERVSDLEDSHKWLARLAATAVVLGLLAPAFVALVVTK